MTWGSDHVQIGAYALSAFRHDTKTDMGLIELVVAGQEADAIVAHLKAPGGLLLYIEPDLRGPGVLSDIGQRFLNNMQHLYLQVR